MTALEELRKDLDGEHETILACHEGYWLTLCLELRDRCGQQSVNYAVLGPGFQHHTQNVAEATRVFYDRAYREVR